MKLAETSDKTVIEYKCPCCNAGLKYDSKTGEMVCEYCDNKFSVEQLEQLSEIEKEAEEKSDAKWDKYESTKTEEEATEFICQSCGAAITGDDTMAATECPYCGNPVIIKQRIDGLLRPDYVIPFKLDKQAAKDALKKFYKGKVLLPKMFREENNIDKITGIYVPFWLFDCEANGRMSFDATRVSSWRSGDYQYTKTSHFLVRRSGEMAFEKIPVDASEKMDDAYMDSLEPFNYNEMVDFGSAYLSGFFADRYDVSDEECSPRAAKRVRTSLEDELRATVVGYSGVTTKSSNIKTSNGDIKYALFPVYMLNTKYRGKTYTFAMNGQTGKFVGKLPVSKGRFAAWAAGIAAAVALVAQLILLL